MADVFSLYYLIIIGSLTTVLAKEKYFCEDLTTPDAKVEEYRAKFIVVLEKKGRNMEYLKFVCCASRIEIFRNIDIARIPIKFINCR